MIDLEVGIGFGPTRYVFSFTSEQRPTPLTRSFEDDMISISEQYGSCWRDGLPSLERSRYLHSWALYRLYRAVLRPFVATPDEPFILGELEDQGRRFSNAK